MIYTYAAVAVVAAVLSAGSTWQVQGWRFDAREKDRIEAAAELASNNRQAAQSASEGLENDRTRIEVKYRTITRNVEKIIDRPIYLQRCLDDDGLHALRGALGTASDTSEPADAVPESR